MSRRPFKLLLIFAAAGVSGCASSVGETGGLSLPKLPAAAEIAPAATEPPAGSATEVYARIARGANSCWFAANGPLKRDYIYHADADAPSRGGKAEITVHARDPSQPNPRGAKSFKIKIEPDGEKAKVASENLRMPETAATEMSADVERWTRGEQGCAGAQTAAGWAPQSPPPTVVKAEPKKAAKPADKKKASAAR